MRLAPGHIGRSCERVGGWVGVLTFFNTLFCLWKNSTLMSPQTGSGCGNSNSITLSSRFVWDGLEVWIFTFNWYTTNWGSGRQKHRQTGKRAQTGPVARVCGLRGEGRRWKLTAGPPSEHGDGFKQHLVKEQSDWLVEQLVPQQEAVVDDVAPLRGDGDALCPGRE